MTDLCFNCGEAFKAGADLLLPLCDKCLGVEDDD